MKYEVITENAESAKPPLAEYTRLQALNKKVTVKYEIVADVLKLKKLITEFGKIESNLNQGGLQSAEMLKSLWQCMAEIYTMKYEVLKMAGSFATDAQHTDTSKEYPHGDAETHSS